MTHGITFTDENMTVAADKLKISALKHGCDTFQIYQPGDISEDFKEMNAEIFDGNRGAGCYWLFKPYFIYRALLRSAIGDYVMYSDAGVEIISNLHEITGRMDENIMFFSNGWNHHEWCKGICYHNINNTYIQKTNTFEGEITGLSSDYMNHKQVQASNIFFRVNEQTRRFVKEWLLWCQFPDFINDEKTNVPDSPTFADHRHDQAILTCMQIKYGYKLHWFPSTYAMHIKSDYADDGYPATFFHHRKRNAEW